MQKKFSYSVLKWTLFLGVASSLGTACVVSSGKGDLSDGGEPSTDTGGEPSTTGGSSSGKGGTSASGSSTGGSSKGGTGGSGGTATAGGEGGGGATGYVAGLCQADNPTPTMLPSCSESKPNEDPCRECLRTKDCNEWKECYGDTPTTACGYGPEEGDGGQFGCILKCFFTNESGETMPDMLLDVCTEQCALQCDNPDNGIIMDSTNALVGKAYADCKAECFPFE